MLHFTVKAQQPNFIVIVADDLNDYIGVLGGHPQVETPNIDSLALSGVTFYNAFCNSPGCAPSRTSMLSGKDPNYTKVFNNEDYDNVFRNNFTPEQNNEEVYTLPQMLKDSGIYFTYAIDKVFHSPAENDYDKFSTTCVREKSWSRMLNINTGVPFNLALESYAFGNTFDFGMIPDSLESQMDDFIAADSAASFIHQYANGTVNTCDRPFFLTLGLHKPHADRYIPEKYFPDYFLNDLFTDTFKVIYNSPVESFPFNGLVMPPQPDPMFNDFYQLPEEGLAQSCANVGDVYNQINDYTYGLAELPEINADLSEAERNAIVQETIRANYVSSYIAAVNFMDAMVGKVLDAINEHPELASNTIIIFTSDNGYSLGEKRHWTKWGLWETDIRVPLIIKYPGHAENVISNRVVSLLDIYPTICDMAGVNYPMKTDGTNYLDGHSFISLLDNPDAMSSNVAVSTYKKNAGMGACFPHISVRNERFHYIRYQYNNNDGAGACDETSANYDEELYDIGSDRQTDPYEWNNLAYDPDYAPMIEYLSEFFPDGNLYNTNPYTVNIYNDDLPCLLSNDETINMRALLIDDSGTSIPTDSLINYSIQWTNNLTAAAVTGVYYIFNMNTVPAATFEAANQIIFYVKVIENATGKTRAFKLKQFYINPENEPEITFTAPVIDHTVSITDIITTGDVTSIDWDFGDGYTTTSFAPGLHTYTAAGSYVIKATLNYGNKCSVQFSRIVVIDELIFRKNTPLKELIVYPNPSSSTIYISSQNLSGICDIAIINSVGELMQNKSTNSALNQYQLDISKLPTGFYFIQLKFEDGFETATFEVMR